jgi:hypothetical protein
MLKLPKPRTLYMRFDYQDRVSGAFHGFPKTVLCFPGGF